VRCKSLWILQMQVLFIEFYTECCSIIPECCSIIPECCMDTKTLLLLDYCSPRMRNAREKVLFTVGQFVTCFEVIETWSLPCLFLYSCLYSTLATLWKIKHIFVFDPPMQNTIYIVGTPSPPYLMLSHLYHPL